MPAGTVTIEQAIRKGKRRVALPAVLIFLASIPVSILLAVYVSWWCLTLVILGEVLSIGYRWRATPRWQIWAYENVRDIHQFQRAAELSGLLPRYSHESAARYLPPHGSNRLAALQQRFLEDPGFVDDPSIPKETVVKYQPVFSFIRFGSSRLTLSDHGIRIGRDEFYGWEDISNERLALVANDPVMRFQHQDIQYEIQLGSLDISAWKLDLLLYIYRGRFTRREEGTIAI